MTISRIYNFTTDYINETPIDDRRINDELDQIINLLNQMSTTAAVDTKIETAIEEAVFTLSGAAILYPDKQNLKIDWKSNSTVDIDADYLFVEGYRLSDIDLTVDIAASGANGLDTGDEANSTWYSLWVIYNPDDVLTASLISASATSPTLPTGYTKKRRVGWVYNNSSGNILQFYQSGAWFHTPVTAGVFEILANGQSTTRVALACAGKCPSTARMVSLNVSTVNGGTEARYAQIEFADYDGGSYYIRAAGANAQYDQVICHLTSDQKFGYRVSAAGAALYIDINGWHDPI